MHAALAYIPATSTTRTPFTHLYGIYVLIPPQQQLTCRGSPLLAAPACACMTRSLTTCFSLIKAGKKKQMPHVVGAHC